MPNFELKKYCQDNYLPILKNIKFINQETNFNANLDNFLNITFDKTFKVTDYVYTNIFFNYTKKMWDLEPQELDPAVLSRVPIQIGYDDRYFHDKYQSMPKNGYTKMFQKI